MYCIWKKRFLKKIQDEYPNMTNTEVRNLLAAFLLQKMMCL